jgi:hypothetical protein
MKFERALARCTRIASKTSKSKMNGDDVIQKWDTTIKEKRRSLLELIVQRERLKLKLGRSTSFQPIVFQRSEIQACAHKLDCTVKVDLWGKAFLSEHIIDNEIKE